MGYKYSKDYRLLWKMIKSDAVICRMVLSDGFSPSISCTCRRWKNGDITFNSRGTDYGVVSGGDDAGYPVTYEGFEAECIRLNIEFLPFND